MPAMNRSRNRWISPLRLKVAIARRSRSASSGGKPAPTMAICIACSWNNGTPRVFSSTRRNASEGYSTSSLLLRDRMQFVRIAVMPLDQVEALADAGQHAEGEDVDLQDPERVEIVLVPF